MKSPADRHHPPIAIIGIRHFPLAASINATRNCCGAGGGSRPIASFATPLQSDLFGV